MAFERIKRNRYQHPQGAIFTHGSEHHFQDHEEFHRPLLRVDSAALRGDWGIAAGLEVSGTPGAGAVVIDSGAAVDKPGETIVLSAGGFGDIGANPPGNQHDEKPVPVSLPLAGQAGQTVYVTIQFNEISRSNEGSGGRFEQVPWLRLQPTSGTGAYIDDGTSIILAIVVVSATGTLSDLRAQDGGLPFGRRLLGRRSGPVRLKRRQKAGDKLSDVTSGTIAALDGGGLRLAVPNTSDVVHIEQDAGGGFANLDIHANDITARNAAGQVTVELDTAAARITAGTEGVGGDIDVRNAGGRSTIQLEGDGSTIHIRDNGELRVHDNTGASTVRLGGTAGDVEFKGRLLDPVGAHGGIGHDALGRLPELIGGGVTALHRHTNSGNAAQAVAMPLFNNTNLPSTHVTISLPSRQRVFAFIAITSFVFQGAVHPPGLAFADITRVDGQTRPFPRPAYGLSEPFYIGLAQSIEFRLISPYSFLETWALAVVMPEG
jgi:hypothetical protein